MAVSRGTGVSYNGREVLWLFVVVVDDKDGDVFVFAGLVTEVEAEVLAVL